MRARPRRAGACPWRGSAGLRGGSGCRLASRLAEDETPGGYPVGDEVCAACCRSSRPTERGPNGVVASMAHGILGRTFCAASSVEERVRISERIAWVERFLEEGDCAERGRTDGRPGAGWRLPRRLHRATRIGLIGWDNLKGLGHQNRGLRRWLPLDRWLVPGRADGPIDTEGAGTTSSSTWIRAKTRSRRWTDGSGAWTSCSSWSRRSSRASRRWRVDAGSGSSASPTGNGSIPGWAGSATST